MTKGNTMKHEFCNTGVVLGIALFLGSGAVWAAEAISDTKTPIPSIADKLNTTGNTSTTVGNTAGVTLGGNTTVTGNITTAAGTVSGQSVKAGVGGVTSDGNISTTTGTVSGQGIEAGTDGIHSAGNTDIDKDLSVVGDSILGTEKTSTNLIQGKSTTISAEDISGLSATTVMKADSAQTTVKNGADSATTVMQADSAQTTVTHGSNSATTAMQANSAQTTVTNGTTTTQMLTVNAGEYGARVDANGKITMGQTNQSTASLTVTNGQGNTHGFVVNESSATMSGGTHSTTLTVDDDGARFSSASTGGPVRVTGVADGRHDYDAVKYRQLKSVKSGIAGIAAMTNIPLVEQNRKFALGVGVGHYDGATSMALGASARLSENAVIKASISNGIAGGTRKSTVYGVGAGFSW
jgi:hypothetical protein